MATQNDFYRSFQVNAAMSANRRVAISNNGKIGYASATELGVGILQEDTSAGSYESPSVRLYGTGTLRVAISAITTTGDSLICAANGLVVPKGATTSAIMTFGTALSGAAASGQLIEAQQLFYNVAV